MLLQDEAGAGAEDVVVSPDPLDDLVEALGRLHVDDGYYVLVSGDFEDLGHAVILGQLPGYLLGVGVTLPGVKVTFTPSIAVRVYTYLHERLHVLRTGLDREPADYTVLGHLVDPAADGPLRDAELLGYLDVGAS